jgi:hypothetical protein
VNSDWQALYREAKKRVDSAKLNPVLSQLINPTRAPASIDSTLRILENEFDPCLRYIKSRSRTTITINDESQLQDFVFLILKSSIDDLIPETPTGKAASRFAIEDFFSKKLGLVIEAKYIRDKNHGRNVTKELHDDIEMYRTHDNCSTIVFFVYDPSKFIPSVSALVRHLETKRTYDQKPLGVRCIVRA